MSFNYLVLGDIIERELVGGCKVQTKATWKLNNFLWAAFDICSL